MKHFKYLYFTLLFISISFGQVLAQNENPVKDTTIAKPVTDTLVANIPVSDTFVPEESHALLPKKYMLTQKLFWGENGLMRNFNRFELTQENRDYEMKIRQTMLRAHRYIGYATLACMVAQGIAGERLYQGNRNMKDLHVGLGAAVDVGYFATAGLAFFTPPGMGGSPKGFNTYNIHKYLAIVHFSSMIATNILSGLAHDNPKLKAAHRATAYLAYSSFFVSMVVIHF